VFFVFFVFFVVQSLLLLCFKAIAGHAR